MENSKDLTSQADDQAVQSLLSTMRSEAGLRQVDVASRLGRHQSYVSKYESGEKRLNVLELRKICAVLGVSLIDFVRRLEESLSESGENESR